MKRPSISSVLLINPPSKSPNPILPLGLAYLTAYLEERNVSVKVIDAWAEGISVEALAGEAGKINPSIIGVTVTSPQYGSAVQTIRTVKEVCTDSVIVAGGPHASALPLQMLEDNREIDYVVVGEGEISFFNLIQSIVAGTDCSDIQGVACRLANKAVMNGVSPKVENLDELPLPARSHFPISKYRSHPPYGKSRQYMTMITSRGCPYKCTYCADSVFGHRYRTTSPERVIEEILQLKKTYGVDEIHFYDDDFTINKKRVRRLCDRMIKDNLNISWSCTTRVDLVDEQLLTIMKQAGCWLISYGVESADQQILDGVKKGYKVEQIEATFALTKALGIRTVGYFMVGLPGENADTIEKTIAFSKKIQADFVSWGITSLYPGSTLYRMAEKGALANNKSLRYSADTLAGSSSGSPYGDGYAILYEEKLTREELGAVVKRAVKEFYLRPSYLLRFLFLIKSWYELGYYVKAGFQTLQWLLSERVEGKKPRYGLSREHK